MENTSNNNSCEEKIAYESIKDARAAITANSYHYKKPDLKVYRCKNCDLYHVTRGQGDD